MNKRVFSQLEVITTWGVIRVSAHAGALTHCNLPRRARMPRVALRITGCRLHSRTPADRSALLQAGKFIRACLQGGGSVALPPLQPAVRTPFTGKVWAALRRIPAGKTLGYGDVARQVGAPRAARAVGTACGANPLALFIPCHRVVAAGGALGGFSAGLAWKRFLLAKECAS